MTDIVLTEMLLRGATAGMLLVSSALFFRAGKGFGVERLGALFCFGTAAYAIISSDGPMEPTGFARPVFIALATLNSVFFWWFATALFDDNFRWRWWRLAPGVLISGLFLVRTAAPAAANGPADNLFQQAIVIPMTVHVLWLALAHRRDDLVERRRAFRLVFAALVGVAGLVFAVGELIIGDAGAPQIVQVLHAGAIFTLTFGITVWTFSPITVLHSPDANPIAPAPSEPSPALVNREDQALVQRLTELMDDGAYRNDALTIGALAEKMALPEHRLRRLINGALGFRNFSAFLNTHRIKEARALLADPAHSRRQITQIALDLGYGSVGPFNRAFKSETGQTPTDFRKAALGGDISSD
ncbi:MAG: AraC family transcriptional regulator [Pseudomonadota bacterium]